MSVIYKCEQLSKGLNHVFTGVYKYYLEGRISAETLREMIWNAFEAGMGIDPCVPDYKLVFDYARGCLCGNCLSVIEKGQSLYSVLDLSSDFPARERIMYCSTPALVTDRLCEKCFDDVLEAYCGLDGVGDIERKHIKRSVPSMKWKSTGKFGKDSIPG